MKTDLKIIAIMLAVIALGLAFNAIHLKPETAMSQWGINSKSCRNKALMHVKVRVINTYFYA